MSCVEKEQLFAKTSNAANLPDANPAPVVAGLAALAAPLQVSGSGRINVFPLGESFWGVDIADPSLFVYRCLPISDQKSLIPPVTPQ